MNYIHFLLKKIKYTCIVPFFPYAAGLPIFSSIRIKNIGITIFRILLGRKITCKCCICGWQGISFFDIHVGYGHVYEEVICPRCGSQPRHRLMKIYIEEYMRNMSQQQKKIKVLHFAPEIGLSLFLKSHDLVSYLSVDIIKGNAMKQEDITQLSFPDNSFDLIICSHVLEHVKEDKKAIAELYRVIKTSGSVIIDVPIDYTREQTYEDENIRTPQERTKAFWQWDHLRLYGKDFPQKLRDGGFIVEENRCAARYSEKERKYLGLENIPLYIARKK